MTDPFDFNTAHLTKDKRRRISNIEQGMSNAEGFCYILRHSLFNLSFGVFSPSVEIPSTSPLLKGRTLLPPLAKGKNHLSLFGKGGVRGILTERPKQRMSNNEQGMPHAEGFFPSTFLVRYSLFVIRAPS
jgi:hypothetical protein